MISLILAKKILSLFLVMALGIVLVRCGIVRSRDSKVLSMISLYLVMPCVIISSFQVKYQPEILNGLLLALATAVLLHLVLIVVVGFLGKVLKLDGVEETSLIYSNAGNLIIPIVTAILGKEWVIYTSAFGWGFRYGTEPEHSVRYHPGRFFGGCYNGKRFQTAGAEYHDVGWSKGKCYFRISLHDPSAHDGQGRQEGRPESHQ